MPRLVPQALRSTSYQKLQPQRVTSKTMLIIYAELGGATNKDIAELVGLTESRVSIIRNSPLYLSSKKTVETRLHSEVLDKQSDKIVHGDPVDEVFEEAKLAVANEKVRLALESESEFVRNSATSDVLGYRGYRAKSTKTVTTIEVDAKVQDRWDKVLNDRGKLKVKQETTEES